MKKIITILTIIIVLSIPIKSNASAIPIGIDPGIIGNTTFFNWLFMLFGVKNDINGNNLNDFLNDQEFITYLSQNYNGDLEGDLNEIYNNYKKYQYKTEIDRVTFNKLAQAVSALFANSNTLQYTYTSEGLQISGLSILQTIDTVYHINSIGYDNTVTNGNIKSLLNDIINTYDCTEGIVYKTTRAPYNYYIILADNGGHVVADFNLHRISSTDGMITTITLSTSNDAYGISGYSTNPTRANYITFPSYITDNDIHALNGSSEVIATYTMDSTIKALIDSGNLSYITPYTQTIDADVITLPIIDAIPSIIAQAKAGAITIPEALTQAKTVPVSIADTQAITHAQALTISGSIPQYQTVGLSDLFPFCIPFDVYEFVKIMDAEPITPSVTLPLPIGIGQNGIVYQDYTVDLTPFNDVAYIFRQLELLAFIIGLAVLTRSMFIRS